MREEIFRFEKITQNVNEITILNNLNLNIFKGEIMGLLSLNDHGKKALIELICKNQPINYGYVYFLENLVNSYKNSNSSENQVIVIDNPIRLIEDLSVCENIFVIRKDFKKYVINKSTLNSQLEQYTKQMDVNFDTNVLISNLSFYEKCIVLLLKAHILGIKLVIINDISNFISTIDLIKFHSFLKKLTLLDMSFLYICNHHEEAYKICDRLALMENGRVIKYLNKNDFSSEIIKSYTLDFYNNFRYKINKNTEKILSFKNVNSSNLKNLNFDLFKGECIVFLDKNNTALGDFIDLLSCFKKLSSGKIILEGAHKLFESKYFKRNISIIKDNPIKTMLFYNLSYIENLIFLLDLKKPKVKHDKTIEKSVISEYKNFIGNDIYSKDIRNLSIGSLYNLVYFKVHLFKPKIVVLVQPFSGADMYIRHQIICLIDMLLAKKISVIILAVSLSDSLYIADRLLILEKGILIEEYLNKEFINYQINN